MDRFKIEACKVKGVHISSSGAYRYFLMELVDGKYVDRGEFFSEESARMAMEKMEVRDGKMEMP